jgi:hypothetical protein
MFGRIEVKFPQISLFLIHRYSILRRVAAEVRPVYNRFPIAISPMNALRG